MASHAHSTPTSRRALFGAGASLLLLSAAAAGAAKAQELDGQLLRLCTEYMDLHRQIEAIDVRIMAIPSLETPEGDALMRELDGQLTYLVARQCPILESIGTIPSRTPEGIRAKAGVIEAELTIAAASESWVDARWAPLRSLISDVLGRRA